MKNLKIMTHKQTITTGLFSTKITELSLLKYHRQCVFVYKKAHASSQSLSLGEPLLEGFFKLRLMTYS